MRTKRLHSEFDLQLQALEDEQRRKKFWHFVEQVTAWGVALMIILALVAWVIIPLIRFLRSVGAGLA